MYQNSHEPGRNKGQSPERKIDDLAFQPSAEMSLGVELELPILDHETGDLAPGAVRILKACADESIHGATAELMQSMIEIKTDVCKNVNDVRHQLIPSLRRVRNIASSMGYDLALTATHPFHRTGSSSLSPGERYDRISDRLGWLVHQRVVFGLHVHVGMPNGDMAVGVMNMMVQHLPHLLAVTANSPFWQGVDSGLASCRNALYRIVPHAGVPRYFPNWKDFRTFLRVMRDCHAIQSPKDIYWDIRPRPEFGTIEFRICDMPASLEAVFGVVALIRSLAIASRRLLEERPHLRSGDIRRHWIAVENKWLATRYGLNAMYIRTPGGKRRVLSHDLSEVVERLLPIARETGDDTYLKTLLPIDKFESGADEQRRIYRERGDWKLLVDHLVRKLIFELDSYSDPRLPPIHPTTTPMMTSGVQID